MHPDIFWLIEFSQATLDKDMSQKKAIYAEAGIQEYWLVNLKDFHLKVFRDLIDNNYNEELTLKTGAIASLAFPNIKIEVERLLNP
jgi:Uma2 family endonuclease